MAVFSKPKAFVDFYKGQGESDYVGSFSRLINVDVYSELGVAKAQLALARESETMIDEPCYIAVDGDGNAYFFSKTSGKRWKRSSGGAYSSLTSNTNTSGHKGAEYYNGYVYYATNTKLGRLKLSDGTFTDNWQTLNSGEHPFHKFDLILYIGNGSDIAQVDDTGTFSSSGLDINDEYQVKALISKGDDLIVLANSSVDSRVYRWNTIASSWTYSDPVKELNAFAFLDGDNNIFALCKSGNIYYYTGTQLVKQKKLRDGFTSYNHALTTNYQGRPLIAQGNRIYSYYRTGNYSPFAIVGEYTCTGNEINSIVSIGETLLVSHDQGVDNVTNYRADAIIETPIVIGRYSDIIVGYQDIPDNTSIEIEYLIDDRDRNNFTSADTLIDSEDERIVRLAKEMNVRRNVMARVKLNSYTTHTPIIDSIILVP